MRGEQMNMWQFFDNHGFIAWCALWLCWPAIWFSYLAFRFVVFTTPNCILRTIKVLFRGWPPAHLDADGDLRPTAKAPEVKS